MGVANLSITFLFDTISDGSWNKTLCLCVLLPFLQLVLTCKFSVHFCTVKDKSSLKF